MSLIYCKDLTVGYDSRPVASGISFSVEAGDYLCVVGENGSGKSTLMKTVLGLEQPISGEITYGDSLGKKEIGYLPQQTQVQRDFPATVWEIVLSGTLSSVGAKAFYTKEAKQTAKDNLERMGITHLKKRCYRELSGGQQQRVLLARALCATRKLLLLDEPVAGLDPSVTNELYELIAGLNAQGVAIIMISHDVNAIRYANKVLSIGSEIFFGSAGEFASHDNIFKTGGESDD